MSMTEEEVRRIATQVVLSLKDCLRESHIACERCSPGFDERVKHAMEHPSQHRAGPSHDTAGESQHTTGQ